MQLLHISHRLLCLVTITVPLNQLSRELNRQANKILPRTVIFHLRTFTRLDTGCFELRCDCRCCSVAQSCPTLSDPMDCSTPGLPVPQHLLEFAQVHVYCISGAIQPSHPLMSSFPTALNLSQHPGFFPMSQVFVSGSQSIGASALAAVLPMNIQG